jgi:hypothetical protein
MKLAAESLIESDNPVLAVTTWCAARRAPTFSSFFIGYI